MKKKREENEKDSECDSETNISNASEADEEEEVFEEGSSNTMKSWHNRLGHLSTNGLRYLKRLGMLLISKIQL